MTGRFGAQRMRRVPGQVTEVECRVPIDDPEIPIILLLRYVQCPRQGKVVILHPLLIPPEICIFAFKASNN